MFAAIRIVVGLLVLSVVSSGYAEPLVQQGVLGNRLSWIAPPSAEPLTFMELSGTFSAQPAASFAPSAFPSFASGSNASFLIPMASSLRLQLLAEVALPSAMIFIPDESVGTLFIFSVILGTLLRAFSRRHHLAVR